MSLHPVTIPAGIQMYQPQLGCRDATVRGLRATTCTSAISETDKLSANADWLKRRGVAPSQKQQEKNSHGRLSPIAKRPIQTQSQEVP